MTLATPMISAAAFGPSAAAAGRPASPTTAIASANLRLS